MPTPPRQQFYNRLNKIHRELRRSRTNYRTICPKQRAGYAIDQIEQIVERDIASHAAIFRAQKEVTALLADVAFSLENLSADDRARPSVPTKWDLAAFASSDITNLSHVWILLPPKDKDAIRRAADRLIKAVFRRAVQLLKPIVEKDANFTALIPNTAA